jgi:hypothetical protein
MEKELDELISKYEEGNMSLVTLKAELLRLFSVVGRSEQLLALAQYMCQHQNNLDGKTAKDYLQDFLSQ